MPKAKRKEAVASDAEVVSVEKPSKRSGPKCVVCGDPVAPFSEEELCWVCRRLKISAWREADNQLSVQE